MSVCGRLFIGISKQLTRHVKQQPCKYSDRFTKCRNISTSLRRCTDRKYSDKHEWVQLSGKTATIGISHYAQEALGDVVYAQLPEIGTSVTQKEECGALESVKAASELFSPISGKVIEKNNAVEDTPALVNQSCYEKGWLFKLEVTDENELQNLMTEEQYKEFLKTDQH